MGARVMLGCKGFTSLKPVQAHCSEDVELSLHAILTLQVTRALGLRDLKLPRKIVSSEPQAGCAENLSCAFAMMKTGSD